MLSMKEIAKQTGVSVATVSRVFNGSSGVREEVRDRVSRCLEEAGYCMNFQARNLRMQRTNNIVVIVPSFRNPLFAEIIGGMYNEARKLHYSILLGSIEGDLKNADPYLDMLSQNAADGVIFVSKTFDRQRLDRVIGKYPMVLCNETIEGASVPFVSIDNFKASVEASEYLVAKGCRHIAYIAGYDTSPSSHLREAGFCQALASHGLTVHSEDVMFGTNSNMSEYPYVRDFVKHGGFDGYLVNSDIKSAMVIKCLLEEMQVSYQDIHLVSFDGSYVTKLLVPAITSIVQPMSEIGSAAVESLVAQIEKRPFEPNKTIPYKFVQRST